MNAMLNVSCEGDAEAFCRKALDLMDKQEASTLQLNVPNEWWARYCIDIFSDAVDKLPELNTYDEETTMVDIIFNVLDGSGSPLEMMSDEEIQDLIDELMDDLEEEEDDDDDA